MKKYMKYLNLTLVIVPAITVAIMTIDLFQLLDDKPYSDGIHYSIHRNDSFFHSNSPTINTLLTVPHYIFMVYNPEEESETYGFPNIGLGLIVLVLMVLASIELIQVAARDYVDNLFSYLLALVFMLYGTVVSCFILLQYINTVQLVTTGSLY